MCGIAGIVWNQERYKEKEMFNRVIKDLTNALLHRGPDDEGFFFDKNLAFGHRRLAIIDLTESGHQPMLYSGKNGQYVITYNGEIYNYIELKNELKRDGYVFNSNTDTEVILASYDKWGFDCLEKFNGMWSFVIYDKGRKILFGSRDRFGVKPLYYYFQDDIFSFASEIKALLKLPFYKPQINEKAVFKYFVFGADEELNESFFKKIYSLQPSHAFTFDLESFKLKVWQYYRINYNTEYERFDQRKLQRYCGDIRRLIFDAVEIRLRSNVPVGSCLSGGLDSSTIVCVVNQILKTKKVDSIGERQKAFTASYKNENIDESNWASIVVKHTGASWFQTFPTSKELMDDLEDLIYYQEIPFGSTSIYAQYRVMKLARENGIKVLLDGQGGDELFAGYTVLYPSFFYELIRKDIKQLIIELRSIKNSPLSASHIQNIALFFGAKVLSKYLGENVINYIARNTTFKILDLLQDDFLEQNRYEIKSIAGNLPESLNENLFELATGAGLRSLLKYEDRNSMRFSIEARTPFSDDINLIEYVFSIPSSYKIHNGWSKFLLRNSMKGILPDQITHRKDKIGFATPEAIWLKENIRVLNDILTSHKELFKPYLDYKMFQQYIRTGKIFYRNIFWNVINFVLWRSIFKV